MAQRKIHVVINPAAECEGLTCVIANSTNLRQTELHLMPNASVSDGLLDVLIIQQAGLCSLCDVLGSITGVKQVPLEEKGEEIAKWDVQMQQNLQHWQGKEVMLVAEPAHTVQFDGEMPGKVPIRCSVFPHALHILTAATADLPSASDYGVKGEPAL